MVKLTSYIYGERGREKERGNYHSTLFLKRHPSLESPLSLRASDSAAAALGLSTIRASSPHSFTAQMKVEWQKARVVGRLRACPLQREGKKEREGGGKKKKKKKSTDKGTSSLTHSTFDNM